MLLQKAIIIFASLVGLWVGSGLIVEAIKKLSKKFRVPSFSFSFFVLALFTSIPEIAVGINAIERNRPEIFVGNLLGGTVAMFLLVIPLMAILGGRVKIKKHLSDKNLLLVLAIIATPALFAIDKTITNVEGFILIALYCVLFFVIKTRKGVLGKVEKVLIKDGKRGHHSTLLHFIIGIVLVFIASRLIVSTTISVSELYGWSPFIIGLVILGAGTNLPEVSLAIRSLTNKAEDVALGDYLGSAAANTLLFGIFTILNNGEVVTEKQFTLTFIIIVAALGLFYAMTRGKSELTRKEGLALIVFYIAFLAYEISAI